MTDLTELKVRELAMLGEVAPGFRRMRANEDFDDKGIRTIWHRGPGRSEMLTWENRDKDIVRQELQLLGNVVEFRQGHDLRTGRI